MCGSIRNMHSFVVSSRRGAVIVAYSGIYSWHMLAMPKMMELLTYLPKGRALPFRIDREACHIFF